ncbi:MAG TPA: hypothetical protein VFP21_10780 [Solirubrobacterales bacterium]|nr:hypothetical protein [Solirubrobacterales bacterium]
MTIAGQEEERLRSLLAPFGNLEPASLKGRLSRRRRLAVYALLVSAAVLTGVSLAGSFNPLSGIRAANHPRQPSDVLGPDVTPQLRLDSPPGGGGVDQIGVRLADSGRLIGTLPSGRKVYVVPTTKGRVCVVVAGLAESCGDPLTQDEPVTFTTVFRHPGDPTYAYGVARDGVTAVSFAVGHDQRVTLPVQHNFFAYESEPGNGPHAFRDVSVTFSDGTVQPVG